MNTSVHILNIFNNACINKHISTKDFWWIKSTLEARPDAHDYFLELALTFNDLWGKPDHDVYNLKLYKANKELEKLKTFFFKQRTILLAVPQRKKHPNFPAPNLGGIIAPQNYRLKGEVCYGMPHAEARNWLVMKARENPDITDILFIDDDILLPLDAITKLCDSNELIVSCNYVKKQFPIETCALKIDEGIYQFHNKEVLAEKNSITPIAVTQLGMGACLINMDVFNKIEPPWFEFVYNKDGSIFVGEDVRFCQKAIIKGIIPKVIPGLVPIHVDFRTGKYWGPDWLIENHFLKKEYIDQYCAFQCDPKDCYTSNVKIRG